MMIFAGLGKLLFKVTELQVTSYWPPVTGSSVTLQLQVTSVFKGPIL